MNANEAPRGDDPRAAELELLNEVARIATLDLELRPMLQRITDALSHKFEWEFVALVTIDSEQQRFMCEAVTSSQPTAIQVGYTRPRRQCSSMT
jgi:transcriptional regulator with GAF, ATPase, and Fis domain